MLVSSRISSVLHLCSLLALVYSLTMLIPLVIGSVFNEPLSESFLLTFIIGICVGGIGWKTTKKKNIKIQNRDAFLVAVLFWLVFSILSSLPFYLDSRTQLTLVDSMFEGISGITTTGGSIFSDVDSLPKSILYYRSQLNFLGGLGIIVLAVAVTPILGSGAAKLFQSEVPGPSKEDRFTPRIVDTARSLWIVYFSLAFVCCISYWIAGMNWFDALCHALSTVSLGGFSTHNASFGFYESHLIELLGGIFSFLAAINFSLYYMSLVKRSIKPVILNSEFKFFSLALFLVVAITCSQLYSNGVFDAQESLVHGFFIAASVMTDNGLAGGHYPAWPDQITYLLLMSSFFGGCVGSTCGGIKAMRFLLLYRQSQREIVQYIHPSGVFPIKIKNRSVPDKVIRATLSLFFFYIFFTGLFVLSLMMLGYNFDTAFGTVAACINNMGIGYGETASSFAPLSPPAKWLMCVAMLFGRLEIFPILIVMSRSFWKF